MLLRSSCMLRTMCCGGLLVALFGCRRSAVVVVPERASHAEESTAEPRQVARGKDAEVENAPFAFPDDAGGVLLTKVLTPKETEAARPDRTHPLRRSSSTARMKPPTLPLPPSHAAMPHPPLLVKSAPLRPRLAIDETLSGLPDTPALPQPPSLPERGRVRVSSVDVNQPIPLPIRTRPISDRASLDDPTVEASSAAALAASIPRRITKAPFLKLTLPDPYDRRRDETIATPAEQTEPPLASPQTPRR
jgi:hypothetical protein